ncbi:hypothetical protein ELH53_11600 [Rhizobium ruizarguesonis]|jgi:hypothetical protein|uniref:hypothetical protein n=1 Tax=Rhizobium ruizarguesonis TaxID=2081791 RepID=UPI0003620480|nr:hypothetical protein [Rhizobium ruizarguesonis]MBY5834342.1 hypothetical protein [Rhizobium leguminosarum]QJS27938.1 hypothetical protein RLTA1_11860 [Rhizobium leguminosarum bv. trifolii TA1]MBY5858144.1 hypothetical protein [Rhizobium leguminosarum]MBY5876840.1 hypothetical protein [Rhizobium leguminosarum]NEH66814.1 hypothetical protein [Rhizobium ruizarguesonis]
MSQKSQSTLVYLMLLVAQSASAFFLFWQVFPIFRSVVTNLGARQDIDLSTQIAIVVTAIILHACYWTRLHWADMEAPFHGVFVGHVLLFASRLNFLFSGALFSAVFFRHLPELASLPPFGEALVQALSIAAVLFGLFCYSLELERLGKAIWEPPQ